MWEGEGDEETNTSGAEEIYTQLETAHTYDLTVILEGFTVNEHTAPEGEQNVSEDAGTYKVEITEGEETWTLTSEPSVVTKAYVGPKPTPPEPEVVEIDLSPLSTKWSTSTKLAYINDTSDTDVVNIYNQMQMAYEAGQQVSIIKSPFITGGYGQFPKTALDVSFSSSAYSQGQYRVTTSDTYTWIFYVNLGTTTYGGKYTIRIQVV